MKNLLLVSLLLLGTYLWAQPDFSLEVVPTRIEGLPPLHSFTHGQWNGKWVLLGGQTTVDFHYNCQNTQAVVIDPATGEVWAAEIDHADPSFLEAEQLFASFGPSFQDGPTLYLAGGYGYSSRAGAYLTFPYLCAIDLPGLIEAVIGETKPSLGQFFRQAYHPDMAVMEGSLLRIDGQFYLIDGYRLPGVYESEQEDFQKEPLRLVRPFFVEQGEDGALSIEVRHGFTYGPDFETLLPTAAPQVFPDLGEGLTLFESQAEAGLSWLNVFDMGYSVQKRNTAELPHYHSAVIALYDEDSGDMHTLFLGGCRSFWCEQEASRLPFRVEQAECFTRSYHGEIEISTLPIDPYQAWGRSTHFLPAGSAPTYPNGVIRLGELPAGRHLIGYLFGGASCPTPLLFRNGETPALASNQLFAVYLVREDSPAGKLGLQE